MSTLIPPLVWHVQLDSFTTQSPVVASVRPVTIQCNKVVPITLNVTLVLLPFVKAVTPIRPLFVTAVFRVLQLETTPYASVTPATTKQVLSARPATTDV